MGRGSQIRRRLARRSVRCALELLEERLCLSHAPAHPGGVVFLHNPPVHHAVVTVHPHQALLQQHHAAQTHQPHAALHPHRLAPMHQTRLHRDPVPTSHRVEVHEHRDGPEQVLDSSIRGGRVTANYPGVSNTGADPADDNLAVSGTEVVEAANEVLAFWDKSGVPVTANGVNTLGLSTLFPGAMGSSVYDPRIAFDPANGGHFLVIGLEMSTSPQASYIDIAVSTNASPTPSTTSWHVFRVNSSTIANSAGNWLDFPGLGFDGTAIYVTGNLFTYSNYYFSGAELFTFDKNALETATAVGGTPIALAPSVQQVISDGASLQPAVTTGPAPAEYLVETWGTTTLRVHAVTNPLNPSTFSRTTAFVTVPAYGMSIPGAPQYGSTNLVATNDPRVLNAVFANGSLYTADTIQNTSGGQNKATVRWYQIGMSGWPTSGTPALVQSGNIDPGPGIATFFPSIAADPSGNIAIGYSESSSVMYPSVYETTIPAGGTPTTTQVHAGQAPYLGSRWGDYSGTVADPGATGLFWTVGMATNSNGTWGTWWSSTAPATDRLTVSAPTSATAGTPVSVTVSVQAPSGAVDSAYTGTIAFTSTDGQAVLPASYTFTAADGGTHTFNVVFNTQGSQALSAADTVNSNINGTQTGISVTTQSATSFVVSGFPGSTTAGQAQGFTVYALLPSGAIATNYAGTVRFSSSDVQAGLPADYTFTASDAGVHSFIAALKTAGSQSITARDTSNSTLTGTESGIAVSPASAASFLISGYPSPVTAGTAHSFTVRVRDVYGNTVSGYTGAVVFSSSDGLANLPGSYTFTLADAGVHSFSATFQTAGYQSLSGHDSISTGIGGMQSSISVTTKKGHH